MLNAISSLWFWFRRYPRFFLGAAVLSALLGFAVYGRVYPPFDPYKVMAGPPLMPPGSGYWLGTDELGRDILSRVAAGIGTSLFIGLSVSLAATTIGVLVGAVAGYFRSAVDAGLRGIIEVAMVIPIFFFAIVIVAVFGPSIFLVIGVLSLKMWALTGRVVRSEVLSLKQRPYIEAAGMLGLSRARIIVGEILPNVFVPVITTSALLVGSAILIEAGLSYIGLGDPNQVSLGLMLQQAQPFLVTAWWTAVFPGALVFLAIYSVNLIADDLPSILEKATPRGFLTAGSAPSREVSSVSAAPSADGTKLQVDSLSMGFGHPVGGIQILDDVSIRIARGEAVALVGESACGKSMTALSIMGLLPSPGQVFSGRIWLDDVRLLDLSQEELCRIRGNRLSMVFQDPTSYLNPLMRVGDQIAEALIVHRGLMQRDALQEAVAALKMVRIPSPDRIVREHPHKLSGGMRQRVMIAMAIVCRPEILIADEPTTALDVTVQAQVMELLADVRRRLDMSLLLITHDLGIVAEYCDRAYIMYAGQVVECGPVEELLRHPSHPYTEALVKCSVVVAGQKFFAPIEGQVPDFGNLPTGCRFHPRCSHAMEVCEVDAPPFEITDKGCGTRCWLPVSSAKKVGI